jgi:small-conductance mechanosensitive channel
MGISTAPILTALGIGGLATALALQDTLSNLFAGFYISLTKHIKPGHFIRLENGFEGYVHDIGWRHTKVYSKEGKIILIPNTKIWSLIVTNYSLPDTLSTVEIKLSISNKNDIKRVEEIIYSVGKEIIIRTEGCLPESNIEITYSSFSDTTINLVLTLKTKDSKYNTFVKAAFLKELNNKFLQENFISYTLS